MSSLLSATPPSGDVAVIPYNLASAKYTLCLPTFRLNPTAYTKITAVCSYLLKREVSWWYFVSYVSTQHNKRLRLALS